MFFSSLLICFCSTLSNLICSNLFLLPCRREKKRFSVLAKNRTSRWKFYDLIAYRQKLILSLIQTALNDLWFFKAYIWCYFFSRCCSFYGYRLISFHCDQMNKFLRLTCFTRKGGKFLKKLWCCVGGRV